MSMIGTKYTSWWFTTMDGKCIGIVKIESSQLPEPKFYIGGGKGISQREDELYIARYGCPFNPDVLKQML